MKSLYKYIQEEIAATPDNTMGVGNPMPAGVTGEIGSEPLVTVKTKQCNKDKKCKKYKKFL